MLVSIILSSSFGSQVFFPLYSFVDVAVVVTSSLLCCSPSKTIFIECACCVRRTVDVVAVIFLVRMQKKNIRKWYIFNTKTMQRARMNKKKTPLITRYTFFEHFIYFFSAPMMSYFCVHPLFFLFMFFVHNLCFLFFCCIVSTGCLTQYCFFFAW